MSDFDRNYSAVRGFGADRAAAIGLNYGRIGEVAGFNYSDGKRVSYLLLVPKESP